MAYDSLLFCDIIESIQGISFVRQDEDEDVKIRIYDSSISGKTVRIDVSYDEISVTIGKAYLTQLGLTHLINSIFPPTQEVPQEVLIEHEKLKAEALKNN